MNKYNEIIIFGPRTHSSIYDWFSLFLALGWKCNCILNHIPYWFLPRKGLGCSGENVNMNHNRFLRLSLANGQPVKTGWDVSRTSARLWNRPRAFGVGGGGAPVSFPTRWETQVQSLSHRRSSTNRYRRWINFRSANFNALLSHLVFFLLV